MDIPQKLWITPVRGKAIGDYQSHRNLIFSRQRRKCLNFTRLLEVYAHLRHYSPVALGFETALRFRHLQRSQQWSTDAEPARTFCFLLERTVRAGIKQHSFRIRLNILIHELGKVSIADCEESSHRSCPRTGRSASPRIDILPGLLRCPDPCSGHRQGIPHTARISPPGERFE
jgi:hypothetical protein